MKYAWPLFYCYKLGTAMASEGASEAQVIELLVRAERTGLTARRVLRAYREQLARA